MEERKVNGRRLPLGWRLCNPLNIRYTCINWIGLSVIPEVQGFCQFVNFYYGWRAAIMIITETYRRRGWNTLAKIISFWAPPEDGNDTARYIAFVSRYSGVDPHEELGTLEEDKERWKRILVGMARMEIGYAWVDSALVKHLDDAIEGRIKYLKKKNAQ
jgi:hypothetical protein